jgi:P-type E1-E2 ATPase
MTQSGVEKTMRAAKVRAGMVLKVLKNEYIPVDGLVLNSSSATVYVDTANIDGETALKKK